MVISRFPVLFGNYILLDRVNAGGMAEVFRAKVTGAEQFQRLVAIKCMLPQLISDQHFTSMFIDEAKLAAQLSHANIVQIYELGRLGERLYITMELVHGRDLRHIIRTAEAAGVPMPRGFAAYVVSRAAAGLDFAHRKEGIDGQPLNLVHRDVSPQNILVSYDGEIKVVDFGIAKAEARATETQAGVLKGKFAYMAPEQVMGEKTDRRADIFALGTVLYEALTGRQLFAGDTDMAVLENVRTARVPDLTQVLPAGTDELVPILQRTLSLNPAARWSYASEFADALEQLLIEDRAIFGPKRAAQFMQQLYAAEISEQGERLRRYAGVNASDCVANLGVVDGSGELSGEHFALNTPRSTPLPAATQLTPTPTPIAPVPAARPAASPRPGPAEAVRRARPEITQPTPQRQKVRAPAGQLTTPSSVPRRREKESALKRRPALPAAPQQAKAAPVPEPGRLSHAGRIVRRLTGAVVLISLLLAALVLLVLWKAPPDDHSLDMPGMPPMPPMVRKVLDNTFPKASPGAAAPSAAKPAEGATPAGAGEEGSESGWLQLHADNGQRGRVIIDGEEVGILPLTPRQLRLGRHVITIIEPGNHVRRLVLEVTAQHTRRMPLQAELGGATEAGR